MVPKVEPVLRASLHEYTLHFDPFEGVLLHQGDDEEVLTEKCDSPRDLSSPTGYLQRQHGGTWSVTSEDKEEDYGPSFMDSPEKSRGSLEVPGSQSSSALQSRSRHRKSVSSSQSAPMLPAVDSPHIRSIYASSSSSWRAGGNDVTRHSGTSWRSKDKFSCSNYPKQWTPLGSTWRERNMTTNGDPVRLNCDDGLEFVDGCVPNWSHGSIMRMRAAIAQRLCWTYYQIRRNKDHPQYQEVGETMSLQDVPSAFRVSQNSFFRFWQDLRPPFQVDKLVKVLESTKHPDGDLYSVSYTCGIDYMSERQWGLKQNGSTFDNRVSGVAQVRIPDLFPGKKGLQVVSWGHPVLNIKSGGASIKKSTSSQPLSKKSINADHWMSLAAELGMRPDNPRFVAVRDAIRRADLKGNADGTVKVERLQKLLFGPHPSLPSLVKAETSLEGANSQGLDSTCSTKDPKMRQFRVWTSCAGFVRYEG